MDLRDEYVAAVVNGKSFADMGGLWQIVGQRVTTAYKAGAASVTMIDIIEPGTDLWNRFNALMAEQGIKCDTASADICSQNLAGWMYDVVHCSGVLYHHPCPMEILKSLRRMTRLWLILSSCIVPPQISNKAGSMTISESSAIFVPALPEGDKKVLHNHFAQGDAGFVSLGITTPVDFKMDDFTPCWWIPTSKCLRAMAETAGFSVVRGGKVWGGRAETLLLRSM